MSGHRQPLCLGHGRHAQGALHRLCGHASGGKGACGELGLGMGKLRAAGEGNANRQPMPGGHKCQGHGQPSPTCPPPVLHPPSPPLRGLSRGGRKKKKGVSPPPPPAPKAPASSHTEGRRRASRPGHQALAHPTHRGTRQGSSVRAAKGGCGGWVGANQAAHVCENILI